MNLKKIIKLKTSIYKYPAQYQDYQKYTNYIKKFEINGLLKKLLLKNFNLAKNCR